MTFPAFRRSKAPALKQPMKARQREAFRGSARERGYTGEWETLRDAYIQAHPFCEECGRLGYLAGADVVDHMKPVRDCPEGRLDGENLDSLCHEHHNGWKRRIEHYARQTGQIALLPVWVKQPDLRPSGFQILVTGPVKADGTLA